MSCSCCQNLKSFNTLFMTSLNNLDVQLPIAVFKELLEKWAMGEKIKKDVSVKRHSKRLIYSTPPRVQLFGDLVCLTKHPASRASLKLNKGREREPLQKSYQVPNSPQPTVWSNYSGKIGLVSADTIFFTRRRSKSILQYENQYGVRSAIPILLAGHGWCFVG